MQDRSLNVYRVAYITWIGIGVLGMATALVATWTVGAMLSESSAFVLPWVALGLLVFGWCWYVFLLQVAYEVRYWPDDGRVVFRSILREKHITVAEISWIRRASNRRTVVVEYRGGSARLPPFVPMLDFVRAVRENRPSVVAPDV
jgi:hypothetical protein